MFTFLVVVLSLFAYCVSAGIVFQVRVRDLRARKVYMANDAAFVQSVLWPLTAPFFMGTWIANRPERQAVKIREQEQRIHELERECDLV